MTKPAPLNIKEDRTLEQLRRDGDAPKVLVRVFGASSNLEMELADDSPPWRQFAPCYEIEESDYREYLDFRRDALQWNDFLLELSYPAKS